MRRVCFYVALVALTVCGMLSCARKKEVQSQAQATQAESPRPFTTPAVKVVEEEKLRRHIANTTVKRDGRGHIVALYDVESYVEDEELCKVKQDTVKLVEIRKRGKTIVGFMFELPSTGRFELSLDDKLKEMFEDEREEFELFFSQGRRFRATVYQCFAPCQDSREVINLERF